MTEKDKQNVLEGCHCAELGDGIDIKKVLETASRERTTVALIDTVIN